MSCKGSLKDDDAVVKDDEVSESVEGNDEGSEPEEGNDDDAESDSGEANDDDSESEEENDDDSDSEEGSDDVSEGEGSRSWVLVNGTTSEGHESTSGSASLDEKSDEDVAAVRQSEGNWSFRSLFEEEDAESEREVDPELEGSREEVLADDVSDENDSDDGTNSHRSDGQDAAQESERDSSRNDDHDNGNLQIEDNNQDDDVERTYSSACRPDAFLGLPSPKSAHHDAVSDSGEVDSTRSDPDDPDIAFAERERALYSLKKLQGYPASLHAVKSVSVGSCLDLSSGL